LKRCFWEGLCRRNLCPCERRHVEILNAPCVLQSSRPNALRVVQSLLKGLYSQGHIYSHIPRCISRLWRFNDHTFGIPSLCCQEGKPDASSTNVKCSGSGRRARGRLVLDRNRNKNSTATYIANSPSDGTLLAGRGSLVGLTFNACGGLATCCSRGRL
jgi:hypothetical protein